MDKTEKCMEQRGLCACVGPQPNVGSASGRTTNCMLTPPEVIEGDEFAMSVDTGDAGYDGTMAVSAFAGGVPIELDKGTFESYDWDGGRAARTVKVASLPSALDAKVDFVFREMSGAGRWAADSILVRKKPQDGYFVVELPGSITSGSTFNMKVTAWTKDNEIDTSYAADCDITHNGSGDLDITSIGAGSWSSGVWTSSSQKYTGDDSLFLQVAVTETGGSKTGYHLVAKGTSQVALGRSGSLYLTCLGDVLPEPFPDPVCSNNWNKLLGQSVSTSLGLFGGAHVSGGNGSTGDAKLAYSYLRFNVGAYKGSAVAAALRFSIKYTSSAMLHSTTWYYNTGMYTKAMAVPDWGDVAVPTDMWLADATALNCQPRSYLGAAQGVTYSNRLMGIPADAINNLSGDYLTLKLGSPTGAAKPSNPYDWNVPYHFANRIDEFLVTGPVLEVLT